MLYDPTSALFSRSRGARCDGKTFTPDSLPLMPSAGASSSAFWSHHPMRR